MASIDVEVDQILMNLELVTTSKRLAKPFENAYQWMMQLDIHLHPQDTVGTLAFSGKGKRQVNHLTWLEVTEVHQAYERLDQIEKQLVARTNLHEPE